MKYFNSLGDLSWRQVVAAYPNLAKRCRKTRSAPQEIDEAAFLEQVNRLLYRYDQDCLNVRGVAFELIAWLRDGAR